MFIKQKMYTSLGQVTLKEKSQMIDYKKRKLQFIQPDILYAFLLLKDVYHHIIWTNPMI